MAFDSPVLRPLRTRNDIQILGWSGIIADLLPQLHGWLERLDADPQRGDTLYNYLLLVKDSTGDYNGLLPADGLLDSQVRKTYCIAWFHEENEDTALTKIRLAYNLGPDTNPAP